MRNVKYLIITILCILSATARSQTDSLQKRKIFTGWSAGFSWDYGISDNGKCQCPNLSLQVAVELYNRFYVGFGCNFLDEMQQRNYTELEKPVYIVGGDDVFLYARYNFYFKNKYLRLSTPLYIAITTISVGKQEATRPYQTNQIQFITNEIINKHIPSLRPGIMLEINLFPRFHYYVMYSHNFCRHYKLRDTQTGEIVYDNYFNLNYFTICGSIWGNYFRNPKVRSIWKKDM